MRVRLIPLNILILVVLLISSPAAGQAETPTLIAQIGRGAVQSVEWYPGGEYVLVSTATGAWIYTPALHDVAHLPEAHLAALSPDGQWIAGIDSGFQLHIWDAHTFEPRDFESYSPDFRAYSLSWNPITGDLYCVGESGVEDFMMVWRASNGLGIERYVNNPRLQLQWNPQGTHLAAHAQRSGEVWVWGDNPTLITSADAVQWQDETHLITYSWRDFDYGADAKVWDVTTAAPVREFGVMGYPLAFTHIGHLGAAREDSPFVFSIIDSTSGEEVMRPASPSLNAPLGQYFGITFAWSHDDLSLAIGTSSINRTEEVSVVLLDWATLEYTRAFSGLSKGIRQIVWSGDDRTLLVVDERQRISTFDVETGETIGSTDAHGLVGESMAWSAQGDRLAFGTMDDRLLVWGLEQGEITHVFPNNGSPVWDIQWQPNGDRIAVYTVDHFLNDPLHHHVWDAGDPENPEVTELYKGFSNGISRFAWSPDGTLLAGFGGTLYLWESQSGDERAAIPFELPDFTTGASFSCDYMRWSPSGQFVTMFGLQYSSSNFLTSYTYDVQQKSFINMHVADELDRNIYVARWRRDDQLIGLSLAQLWAGGYWGNVTLEVVDPSSGDIMSRVLLEGLAHDPAHGYLSPFGAYAGAIDTGSNGMIWDTSTSATIAWINDAVNMVWSPDETRLVVQRTDGSLWILEADGTILAQIPTLPDMQTAVGELYWSPDSRQLAHLHDGVIDVWQVSM